ncbi:clavesin-2-like [Cimex lectularius]|uniref:CRAL-TRIO domain-containing protein n=1 Tax=Cimex lectularius TaxID=79782 RepID=A0A8I6SGW9_CIMLE|nr:clavesin-2-like [Cimex lectularius]
MKEHGFILDPAVLYKEKTEKELDVLREELKSVFQPNADPAELPKNLKILAENELNELPDKLRSNIKELRQLIEGEENLNARKDDLFLSAFLRGRKHDVAKAFQCLKNFYEFKARYPDMYKFLYPSRNPEVYEQNHFGNLPGLDRKGRRICVLIPARFNIDQVPLTDSFKLGTSILEMMLNDLVLQVSGTVVIFDMGGLSLMMQARLITPTVAWHLALIVQDKIPMRLKAIHIINQPFYFNAVYALFKPLLKKKLRKRIFFHGNDMESLHKHIAPENLPEEMGGTRRPFGIYLTRSLLHLNEHKFKEWETKGLKM